MKALILHGGTANDPAMEAAYMQLTDALRAKGWDVETLRMEQMSIKPCIGCFGCWLKTPGECLQADDGRVTARALAQCDAAIFFTPVSFGGYSGRLKLAVDRMIPNISPLFLTIHGEMHHRLRYLKAHAFLAVGWQHTPDDEAAAVFARLHHRNAINMHAPAAASVVLHAAQPTNELKTQLAELVGHLEVK